MEAHTKRIDRIAMMVKFLTDNPCKMLSLAQFADMFGVAKSSISEDIVHMKTLFSSNNIGDIETVVGASGGVKFIPRSSVESNHEFLLKLCGELSKQSRLMTGGFLFYTDLIFNPDVAKKLGYMLSESFSSKRPDVVLTIETRGIPIAFMTAQALGCPLVMARKEPKMTEGSIITVNYLSASGKRLESMSITKHSIKRGQKVLIIDDFMKGGGTIKGMISLVAEMEAEHVGSGVVIESVVPNNKVVTKYVSLLTLDGVSVENGEIKICPTDRI